jgi:hypothetical protein
MNVSPKDYVGAIQQFPRPTLAQTERFARYVSSAHSWYKHLPIRPKVPFVFFLDPGAGMNRVHTRTGEAALVEIKDESTRFHYTWQKTQDYRRRFGCWNYHAAYGTSFRYAEEGGVVSTAGAGLKILTQSGDWVSIPPDLAKKGTALANAFVHPCPNFKIWANDPANFGLSTTPDSDDGRFQPPTHFVLGRLWSVLQENRDAGRNLELIPQQVLAPHQEPGGVEELRSRLLPPMGQGWDWPDEHWLEQLRASGVQAGLIPSVVKHMEVELMRSLMARLYRTRTQESPEWPSAAMLTVAEGIMEERGGQLAAMTDAMGRFVAAVFPP